MHPDLEKLIVLQRIDLELRRQREEIAAVPARIAALAARSAEAQARQITLRESLAKEEKLSRSLASDVRSQRDRAARLRKQMDTVTTTAQASALEHEIAFAEAEASRLEESELDCMVRTEFLESQVPAADEAVTGTESNLELERVRGTERANAAMDRVDALEAERSALRPAITEAILGTYDRIARSRGTGLAEGVDGKCSACQMLVRPQRWNELRDRSDHDSLLTCESCGRLLYWDPARDVPQRKPPAATSPSRPQETRPADREESIAARIVRGL